VEPFSWKGPQNQASIDGISLINFPFLMVVRMYLARWARMASGYNGAAIAHPNIENLVETFMIFRSSMLLDKRIGGQQHLKKTRKSKDMQKSLDEDIFHSINVT
jgi:hypothetical protein